MELYHNNMSVCAQKVRIVLAEKGLKPVEHHKNLRDGDTHTAEYLRLNPKGVVPTLIDRGAVIIESTIICEYLDDAYPDPPLKPNDTVERARMREWTQLLDGGLHRACGLLSVGLAWRHQILASGGQQLQNRPRQAGGGDVMADVIKHGIDCPHVANAVIDYVAALDKMGKTLARQPWLAGQSYSLADAAMLPYILRLSHLSLEWLWSEGERGAIGEWLTRSEQRANYSAISDYLEPKYIELATSEGQKATPRIKEILENRQQVPRPTQTGKSR